MNDLGRIMIALLSSVMGLALVSVLLSQKANTVGVINASTNGVSGLISAANAPITNG